MECTLKNVSGSAIISWIDTLAESPAITIQIDFFEAGDPASTHTLSQSITWSHPQETPSIVYWIEHTQKTEKDVFDRAVIKTNPGSKGANISTLPESPVRQHTEQIEVINKVLAQFPNNSSLSLAQRISIPACYISAFKLGRQRLTSYQAEKIIRGLELETLDAKLAAELRTVANMSKLKKNVPNREMQNKFFHDLMTKFWPMKQYDVAAKASISITLFAHMKSGSVHVTKFTAAKIISGLNLERDHPDLAERLNKLIVGDKS
jgi:hypothetical protein